MDDLIYRQAAIEAIQKAYCDTEGGEDKYAVWKNVGLTEALHIMQDLPSAQRWIPVTERLPEEKKAVLVWQPRYLNSYTAVLADGEWFVFGGYGTKVCEVTHWMPLPEPPKEEA